MENDFSMNVADIVKDEKFKQYLQDGIDFYLKRHYGPDGRNNHRYFRTPLDSVKDMGLLNVESLSVIGTKLQLGQHVELSRSVRTVVNDLFQAAAQKLLHLRHDEAIAASQTTEQK